MKELLYLKDDQLKELIEKLFTAIENLLQMLKKY